MKRGYVIMHITKGLFLGDLLNGEPVWSKCDPDPSTDAAPVFPSKEEAMEYCKLIRVEGMLLIREAEPDRVTPWGMAYASMGRLAQLGFEPWLQPGTPCVGPPQ